MRNIIENICISCSCKEQEAQEYLEDEMRNLRDLQSLDDLQESDIENACSSLGLDFDYMEYFITRLAC